MLGKQMTMLKEKKIGPFYNVENLDASSDENQGNTKSPNDLK